MKSPYVKHTLTPNQLFLLLQIYRRVGGEGRMEALLSEHNMSGDLRQLLKLEYINFDGALGMTTHGTQRVLECLEADNGS